MTAAKAIDAPASFSHQSRTKRLEACAVLPCCCSRLRMNKWKAGADDALVQVLAFRVPTVTRGKVGESALAQELVLRAAFDVMMVGAESNVFITDFLLSVLFDQHLGASRALQSASCSVCLSACTCTCCHDALLASGTSIDQSGTHTNIHRRVTCTGGRAECCWHTSQLELLRS